MKYRNWYLTITIGFLSLSVIFYLIQISIFHRSHDTLYYFFQDLSFVPVNVLLVTLILDRLLKKREKQNILDKMNMVIGVFFNDVGTDLIKLTGNFIPNISEVNRGLQISGKWTDKDFIGISKNFRIKHDQLVLTGPSLNNLKNFLGKKKDGLLDMLANPNLLEHDAFTNMLWAVFHVADELEHRPDLSNLPGTDLDHLRGDIIRAYLLIVTEWAAYMRHLKKDYPYLFSLAVRTNPFNPDAVITVT